VIDNPPKTQTTQSRSETRLCVLHFRQRVAQDGLDGGTDDAVKSSGFLGPEVQRSGAHEVSGADDGEGDTKEVKG